MSLGTKTTKKRLLIVKLIILAILFSLLGINGHAFAAAGINQEIEFQGRLLNAQGATVPDGYYNMEFKIYENGNGQTVGDTGGTTPGTLLWTEDYLNANSQGVKVVNGFLSVQLGSINPFGNSINWNQPNLWLSMNVGSTSTTCTSFSTCSPDGEMTPMQPLTSAVYSMNSNELNGLTSSAFGQLAANQTWSGLNVYKNTTNSTTAFQIQNSTGTDNLFTADTINNRIGIGTLAPGYTLDVQGGNGINSSQGYSNNGTQIITATNQLENVTTSGSIITSGTVANTYLTNSGALSVAAGTGLTGGGSVALGGSTTLNLANTTVTAGSYGSAADVANFSVNAQGQLTTASSTPIAIAGSQITSGTVANTYLTNSGALSVAAGTGLTGGGSVALGGSTTLNLANTTVTAGSYGSAADVANFSVNAQGQLTTASSTPIAIAGSQITSGTVATAFGGTGINSSTAPNGSLFIGNGNGLSLATLTPGTNLAVVNGSGTISVGTVLTPTFTTVAATGPSALALGTASTNSGAILFYGSGNNSTISLTGPSSPNGGNYVLSIPAITANASICTSNSICSGYAAASGSGSYVDLQSSTPGVAQTGYFNITGTGLAGELNAGSGGIIDNGNLSQTGSATISTGTGTIALNGLASANAGLNVAANQNLILSSGGGVFKQLYSGNTSASAATFNVTNTNASSTVATINGQYIYVSGTPNYNANTNTINGINLATTTSTGNTTNAIYLGTGFSNLLNYNGTTVLNGLGQLNLGQVYGTLSNSNLTGSGQLDILNGNGITGGGTVTLGGSLTIGLSNSGVSANSYGSASDVATFSVNSMGQLTTASNTQIAIAGSQITSGLVGATYGGTGINGGVASDGQLLIGNGTGYTLGTIQSGVNINVTNSIGGISIATVSAPTFSNEEITSANGLALGVSGSSTGGIVFKGSGSNGTLILTGPTSPNVNNYSVTIPTINANDTFCLANLGNCTGIGAAGGDLTGQFPNPTIAKLQGTVLSISTLANGNFLQYNGTDWVNQSISGAISINGSGAAAISSGVVTNTNLVNDSITINPSNGLAGGGIVTLGGSATLSIASISTLTSGAYGSPSQVASFSVNPEGQLTSVSNDSIAIAASQITSGTVAPSEGGTGLNSSTAADGQLLVGNGTGFTLANINASNNILINNGSGSISVGTTLNPTFDTVVISGGGNTLPLSVGSITKTQTVFSTNEPLKSYMGNQAFTSGGGNYTLGYRFTPTVNGQVTALGGDCTSGTYTIQLWTASGTQLATASVTTNGTWSYTGITPVNLTAGTSYVVSLYGNSTYCYINDSTPTTVGNITINYTVYNGGTGDSFPTNNGGSGTMYGLADISFVTSSTATVSLSSTFSGSVGIGTATPNNELSVVGNIAASGTITGGVNNPDYAEDITATYPNTISAGDLVALDPNHPGQVVLSTSAYDPNLIGVISTHPGFVTNADPTTVSGGNANPSQKPLALAGRVPVKVTGQNGPIKPGDYLTASSTPGYAMKATQAGPVIGVAMASFNGSSSANKGSILVFIKYTYYNPLTSALQSNATITGLTVSGSMNASSINVGGLATIQQLNVLGNANLAQLHVRGSLNVSGPAIFYGNVEVIGSNGKPLITINTHNRSIIFGSINNGLVISASAKNAYEPLLYGSARHHKSIMLPVIYSGAVLNSSNDPACASANNGTMTNTINILNQENMYQWTTNMKNPQCSDIVIEIPIPKGFSAWSGAPTLSVYNSEGTNKTSISVEALDTQGVVDKVYGGYVGISSTNKITTAKLPGFNVGSGNQYVPGKYMILKIRLSAAKGSNVEIGNLTLNYLSKY